jgi:diguanylate cyclase (GGDEF)-like protein
MKKISRKAGAICLVAVLLAGGVCALGDVWGALRGAAALCAELAAGAEINALSEAALVGGEGSELQLADGVRRMLLLGPLEMIALLALAGVALLRLRRERNRTRAELERSLNGLRDAALLDGCRANVLELSGRGAPLAETLGAVAEFAAACRPGAGAAIWVKRGDILELAAATKTAGELLETPSLELKETDGVGVIALRDASGEPLGALRLEPAADFSPNRAAEVSRLAAMVLENRLLWEKLTYAAQYDGLTRLPNGVLFRDRLEQAIRVARRNGDRVALLALDMDRYKQINEILGNQTGDSVMREVGRRLSGAVRQCDTAARLGGDRFALLLTQARSVEDAETVATKVLKALGAPLNLEGQEIPLSAACGVAVYPDHSDNAKDLIHKAEMAMFGAKRGGGGAVRVFDPELAGSLRRRMDIESDIRRALERGEFSLEFQPIVDRANRIASLETLCRWNHFEMGPISPLEFIPVAEDLGFISALGEWVMRRACQQAALWRKQGFHVPVITVNVSPKQLARQDFVRKTSEILAMSGLPADRLELELTESVLMKNVDAVAGQIAALRKLGVRFAIDDCGAGYSSLSRLARLPVDCIKIDRAFIRGLDDTRPEDRGLATLVEGIIALAHSLRLTVVAEGVETAGQLESLRAMNCDLIQGFLLYKPVPAEQITHVLERREGFEPEAPNASALAWSYPV